MTRQEVKRVNQAIDLARAGQQAALISGGDAGVYGMAGLVYEVLQERAETVAVEVIRLVKEEGVRPALIVGIPVGFVNAVESKDELLTLDRPTITAVGRKGGSPVAAATMNALLRLAVAET